MHLIGQLMSGKQYLVLVVQSPQPDVAIDMTCDGDDSILHPFRAIRGDGTAWTIVRFKFKVLLEGRNLVAIDVK